MSWGVRTLRVARALAPSPPFFSSGACHDPVSRTSHSAAKQESVGRSFPSPPSSRVPPIAIPFAVFLPIFITIFTASARSSREGVVTGGRGEAREGGGGGAKGRYNYYHSVPSPAAFKEVHCDEKERGRNVKKENEGAEGGGK